MTTKHGITIPELSLTTPASRDYFTEAELQCHCEHCEAARAAGEAIGFNAGEVKAEFRAHLNIVRERFYCQAMPVTSGFRCLSHPIEFRKVRAAQNKDQPFVPGDHPCGVGVDVGVAGSQALYLMEALHTYNHLHVLAGLERPFSAISAHQRGSWGGRFVHIGGNSAEPGRPRPHTWTY